MLILTRYWLHFIKYLNFLAKLGEKLEKQQQQQQQASHFFAGDLSEEGELFRISLTDFKRDVLPTLTEHDCVLWLRDLPGGGGGGGPALSEDVRSVSGLVDK